MGKDKKENATNYDETIEKYIVEKIPVVKENSKVKDVLELMEKLSNTYESVSYVYVVDKNENLVGAFSIKELFNNSKNKPVKELMRKNVITVSPKHGLEKTADLALTHNLKQIPVTKSKKLIGVITSRKILSTLNISLKEDIFHFAGIHKSHLDFKNSLEISVFEAMEHRLPWLVAGLLGAILMAAYIGLFEEMLSKYLIIAFFVPALVYLSGALGAQFQTIFVRDIAVLGRELEFGKYLVKQLEVGFYIASILSICLFLIIAAFWEVVHIAFVISLATFISVMSTSFIALVTTLLIKRFKFDPALGSGPIATIISDIASVVIYFLVVVWLL